MKELEGTTLWIYQNQKAHRNSYTSVSVVNVYPITYHIPFSCSLLLDTSITLLILYSSIITRCICTRFAVDLSYSFTIAPGRSLPDSSLHIFRLVRCFELRRTRHGRKELFSKSQSKTNQSVFIMFASIFYLLLSLFPITFTFFTVSASCNFLTLPSIVNLRFHLIQNNEITR